MLIKWNIKYRSTTGLDFVISISESYMPSSPLEYISP